MPSEYHLRSFWERRFKEEEHFEWLGDGRDTLIPQLRAYLRAESQLAQGQPSDKRHLPRTLHIGAGNSTMSEHIRDAYDEFYGEQPWDEGTIVNLDFSDVAVANGREMDASRLGAHERSMRWVQADVLRWNEMAPLVKRDEGRQVDEGDEDLFAVVLDKSTSDAIACGEDIVLTASSDECHPLVRKHIKVDVKVEPVHLLALNLASIVRPEGVWVILSYSSNRASFLEESLPKDSLEEENSSLDPRVYWSLKEHSTVDAPTGQSKEGVYAPPVQHHVYVLQRSNRMIE